MKWFGYFAGRLIRGLVPYSENRRVLRIETDGRARLDTLYITRRLSKGLIESSAFLDGHDSSGVLGSRIREWDAVESSLSIVTATSAFFFATCCSTASTEEVRFIRFA